MLRLPAKKFSASTIADFVSIEQPNLAEIQTSSYQWILEDGLRELFDEVSPIKDYTGKDLELHFLDYYFDEPKYDEEFAKLKQITFEAALRVKVKLINRKGGLPGTGTGSVVSEKEQEVYMGDFPLMTDRGTFIINGVERVVVSQLIRSPGVYFTASVTRGRKFFGAKVIPNRGAWLEIETELDGAITVKIDRRRKAPITTLLRIFGLADNEEILRTFSKADSGETKHIDATLKKDTAENVDQSYIEIYRRIRPGDLATVDNALSLIDAMFQRNDRYDLSAVGRYKMNQRLKLDENKDTQLLDQEDLVAIIAEVIRLNNEQTAEPDDIDHLGNRRIRTAGELLQNKIRVGLARMRRIVQDRMSTYDIALLTPVQLVNARPLVSVVRDFFSSSQLSQFMDQINPLAEVEHKRRISAMGPGGLTRERAGFDVRDVHRSHYGRLCPIQTPEGANIGLVNHLANYARLNSLGFLETPYAVVKNGKVSSEIVWLDAIAEETKKIAHAGIKLEKNGAISEKLISARVKGEPALVAREEIDLIDIAPRQSISVATSLIPFLEHDDANRALMGSNMQRQAVVAVRADAPYVGTGMEEKAARDSGYLIVAEGDGEITEVDAGHITFKASSGKGKEALKTYKLNKFKRSNQFTCISQKPLVAKGQKVKKGDVLADGPSTDGGVLALGQNLTVAFVPWSGNNFEDAIIISERVVRDDRFTSIHIDDHEIDVRDTKLGPEITTPDIPNVSEDKLKNLDEEGIVRIGAEVNPGDILVGKISPKGESELTAEERLLRAIFGEKARDVKDTSLNMPHGKRGRVVGVKIFSRERGDKLEPGIIKKIQVEVAQLRKLRVGDKLAGRHGNKGIISRIAHEEDMPYFEDGTTVDIVLNPLGVASRMNIGQVLETILGQAAKSLGYRAQTPALDGATWEQIQEQLTEAGLPNTGKAWLHDGRTGKKFSQPVTTGQIYMLKLNHLVEDKIHMRSIGPYSLITQQPLGGKAQHGGQRFGEMEVWALEGYAVPFTLQEMLTIKSDDVMGRASAYESIIRQEKIKNPSTPAAFNVLVNELKALGINVELLDEDGNPMSREKRTRKTGHE
ncbi:MAG: DNA-directed RNA polymerase subunit beta [Candidatus Harrisonbacteria bacterium CG10_big_fil_rev_8_21_14_0_10_49_15]|uniref:DNA-directed RNA polymerase subunit beta n=1 Tax=Candidatus Harrisonbacteria bacterium CG10_big_fil_rev_8_21_14_0_10_49_15 TaxID=1974587 RepID=A0A2H0UNL5_9BACT|nr:MAG: DNA-directed RNA polymerase subunit beta [Candidatus Harrisonbacteria bacterium CG10_big_fil_rev_8_21_14_0_10_49_15]